MTYGTFKVQSDGELEMEFFCGQNSVCFHEFHNCDSTEETKLEQYIKNMREPQAN